jgi:hypothetical protein
MLSSVERDYRKSITSFGHLAHAESACGPKAELERARKVVQGVAGRRNSWTEPSVIHNPRRATLTGTTLARDAWGRRLPERSAFAW